MLDRPEVVHFQQVLNACGSKAVFSWLKRPSIAARVVTVHELDTDQLEFPQTNEMYNQADAVLVHCEEMKQRLMQLGVQREIIHVVLHGTRVPSTHPHSAKQGVVFYGGHKLMSGKGIDTVFKAMSIIRERRPEKLPLLKIHGHYGSVTPAEAIRLAERSGVADNIVWLNQIPDKEMAQLYHGSLLCVLPYRGVLPALRRRWRPHARYQLFARGKRASQTIWVTRGFGSMRTILSN